jgi:hypothetical protein
MSLGRGVCRNVTGSAGCAAARQPGAAHAGTMPEVRSDRTGTRAQTAVGAADTPARAPASRRGAARRLLRRTLRNAWNDDIFSESRRPRRSGRPSRRRPCCSASSATSAGLRAQHRLYLRRAGRAHRVPADRLRDGAGPHRGAHLNAAIQALWPVPLRDRRGRLDKSGPGTPQLRRTVRENPEAAAVVLEQLAYTVERPSQSAGQD